MCGFNLIYTFFRKFLPILGNTLFVSSIYCALSFSVEKLNAQTIRKMKNKLYEDRGSYLERQSPKKHPKNMVSMLHRYR